VHQAGFAMFRLMLQRVIQYWKKLSKNFNNIKNHISRKKWGKAIGKSY
jgi:hypothetical protein